MKIPDEPKKGLEIYDWIRSLVRYLRATRITSVMGGYLKESPSGTILVIDKQKGQTTEEAVEVTYPFEIYSLGTDFISRAGTFNGARDELTQASTTDGTWRLYASLTINATTGEITASSVAWYASAQTDTATTFYHLIGTGVVSDSGATRTVTNFNYGPIFYFIHGSVTGDWTVTFY